MATKTIAIELAENEIIEIQLIRKKVGNVVVPEKKPEKRFFDLNWFIEYTGIPRSSAYQLTSKGTVPFIRRGRKLFFEKIKIEKWLEDGTVKTKAEIIEDAEKYLSERGRRLVK